MDVNILSQIVSSIPSNVLPLVVTVLGLFYIYRKIDNQRTATKVERDTAQDDMDKRLTLCEHDIAFMKEQNQMFADKLDRILSELTAIKVELAKKVEKL